jgi:thiol-disulfide isomerase/thioredoxin
VAGLRFVEHFSPYCHHCRQFAPTWDELVDDYAGSLVNLAQVNCAIYGGMSNSVSESFVSLSDTLTDLCRENDVSGYPQMNLYHDGVFQITFEGVRSHERIVNFIKEHTGVSEPSRDVPPPELPENDLQTPHNDKNPHGEVLALNPETFPSVVANGNVFIKFFAPWWVFRFLRVAQLGR